MKKIKGTKKEKIKMKNKNKNLKLAAPCQHCGYKLKHLHGGQCPMCRHCSSCRQKLHSCSCLEGE